MFRQDNSLRKFLMFPKAQALFLFFLILMLAACGSTKKPMQLHEQALQIEKQVMPQLTELIQIKNHINVQGRALRAEEIALVKEIEAIETSYDQWKKDSANNQRAWRDHILTIQQQIETTLQKARQL